VYTLDKMSFKPWTKLPQKNVLFLFIFSFTISWFLISYCGVGEAHTLHQRLPVPYVGKEHLNTNPLRINALSYKNIELFIWFKFATHHFWLFFKRSPVSPGDGELILLDERESQQSRHDSWGRWDPKNSKPNCLIKFLKLMLIS
jgi:hypothetical protein